jgi:peptidoglycan/LPS O-acetylase OafA/YrhL
VNQSTVHKSTYRSEIDGLRAFAVLSVVAFHAFPAWLKGGFVGVDVFFVISGFLITSHIFEQLDKGKFSFTDFFSRRVKRIFPALIVVILISLIFGWFVLLADEYSQLGKHIAGSAVFISNFIFASEVGYFDYESELKPMLHLWSLAVEEQFYIFWPLCLWLALKIRINLLLLTLVFFFTSFFINIFWVNTSPTETFFWPFGRFWELLSGSILAWIMLPKRNILKNTNNHFIHFQPVLAQFAIGVNRLNKSGITSIFGFLLLLISVISISKSAPFPSYVVMLPISGTLLVIIGGSKNWFSKLFLTNPLAIWFGLISYPLYLWHWPILSYLHILEDITPPRNMRIFGVILSIFLAWGTYRFIEKPIRFGGFKEPLRSISLVSLVMLLGLVGLIISLTDFKESKSVETVHLRKGLEHRIGSSSRWYEGANNWLFLGNSYYKTVEKLKLAKNPTVDEIKDIKNTFLAISDAAVLSNTDVALMIGPNKSSIYEENLPSLVKASPKRYINYFLDELKDISNLTIYDPTSDLKALKGSQGLLYYRTDTHWNDKGAYYAFQNLMTKLGLKSPKVDFSLVDSTSGDLVRISGLKNYPLINDDTWEANIRHKYNLQRSSVSNVAVSDSFGKRELVLSSNPLINKEVWVVGDSFTKALKPYFESTFRKVKYVGHWGVSLEGLADDLIEANEKPDLVIIVRVERTF